MSMPELRHLTTSVGDVAYRAELFSHLQGTYDTLTNFGVRADLWIDGSFMTEKERPSDIDGCVAIHSAEFDIISVEAQNFLDELNDPDLSEPPILDLFTHFVYESDDPRFAIEERSWEWQWSKQHDEQHLKGFASIPIGSASYEPF